jgi:uncharacterized protein YceK
MKKSLSILLVLLLIIVSMTGCTTKESTTAQTNTSQTEAGTVAESQPAKQEITVRYIS